MSQAEREGALVAAEQRKNRLEQERAHRKASRNGGRAIVVRARGRRAPKSASQYRLNIKHSNAAGKHGASKSCLQKLSYDFGQDLRDDQTGNVIRHGRKKDDVAYRFVSHDPGTPAKALDIETMANASLRRIKGMRGDARQMTHITISLPSGLDQSGREDLVRNLADTIRSERDDVPVFAAMHEPDSDNENWHAHISHPIFKIIPGEDGGFKLGDRIAHESQPKAREAMGLPRTNHDEIRRLRMMIAAQGANALESAGYSLDECERWRWGWLALNTGKVNQVTKAVERGDVEFVRENGLREVTAHEGPGAQRSGVNGEAQEVNTSLVEVSPAIVAETLLNKTLNQAERLGVDNWDDLRLLAAEHQIVIHLNRTRSKGPDGKRVYGMVSGVQYQIAGGQKFSGKELHMPMGRLKKRTGLSTPEYSAARAYGQEEREDFMNRYGLSEFQKGQLRAAAESVFDDYSTAQAEALVNAGEELGQEPTSTINVEGLLKSAATLPPPESAAGIVQATVKKPAQAAPAAPPRLFDWADLNLFEKAQMMVDAPALMKREKYIKELHDQLEQFNEKRPAQMRTLKHFFRSDEYVVNTDYQTWVKEYDTLKRRYQQRAGWHQKWIMTHVETDPILWTPVAQARAVAREKDLKTMRTGLERLLAKTQTQSQMPLHERKWLERDIGRYAEKWPELATMVQAHQKEVERKEAERLARLRSPSQPGPRDRDRSQRQRGG